MTGRARSPRHADGDLTGMGNVTRSACSWRPPLVGRHDQRRARPRPVPGARASSLPQPLPGRQARTFGSGTTPSTGLAASWQPGTAWRWTARPRERWCLRWPTHGPVRERPSPDHEGALIPAFRRLLVLPERWPHRWVVRATSTSEPNKVCPPRSPSTVEGACAEPLRSFIIRALVGRYLGQQDQVHPGARSQRSGSPPPLTMSSPCR